MRTSPSTNGSSMTTNMPKPATPEMVPSNTSPMRSRRKKAR